MNCFHEHMIVHLTMRRDRLAMNDWWIEALRLVARLKVVFPYIFLSMNIGAILRRIMLCFFC
jgi:hypothetical protein